MKTAEDCFKHAIKRARERYGLWLTTNELKILSEQVKTNRALHLKTESRTRTHWLVEDKYIVVYNKNLQAITTFLPPECIYNYLGNHHYGN